MILAAIFPFAVCAAIGVVLFLLGVLWLMDGGADYNGGGFW